MTTQCPVCGWGLHPYGKNHSGSQRYRCLNSNCRKAGLMVTPDPKPRTSPLRAQVQFGVITPEPRTFDVAPIEDQILPNGARYRRYPMVVADGAEFSQETALQFRSGGFRIGEWGLPA